MEQILIIGDSGGIGAALREAFEARGAYVAGLSRSGDGFDVTYPGRAEAALESLQGPYDQIWIALGVLTGAAERPEKSLAELDAVEMVGVLAVNTVGPALVMKHAKRLLSRDRSARLVALSARVGSIGDNRAGGWYSYRASKAGLNQVLHTAAIELKRSHKQAVCVAMHPGTVATSFTSGFPSAPKVTSKEAAQNLIKVVEGLQPEDSGGFFDWRGHSVPW
ncbi:MAG: SDR family NAD(P)-dependent oxidoreductase [Pseudomonadota bacterium]|nr:SDR family NAD(P)-dependent oxidoreductase [Pseudomonadota bacterium]